MPINNEQRAILAAYIRDTDGVTQDERGRPSAMTDAEIEQAARDDPDAACASQQLQRAPSPQGDCRDCGKGGCLEPLVGRTMHQRQILLSWMDL